MVEMRDELHGHINSFKRILWAEFTNIEAPNQDGIREEVDILCVEVRSLIESHI